MDSGSSNGEADCEKAAAARGWSAPRTPPNGHDTQHAVEQFLYRQAELLDEKRWQDYIDLVRRGRQ